MHRIDRFRSRVGLARLAPAQLLDVIIDTLEALIVEASDITAQVQALQADFDDYKTAVAQTLSDLEAKIAATATGAGLDPTVLAAFQSDIAAAKTAVQAADPGAPVLGDPVAPADAPAAAPPADAPASTPVIGDPGAPPPAVSPDQPTG